ncbi:sigma-70 family RNA polymerase sigma factor [Acetobacter garciniae]|uniref:sigma-70 family RNA polymerase sigma factor n=1 Tax=Acetobacter garciniae TaxID=2817435 RepID=UPI001E5C6D00|nr:sigma-70 family RNA polymerase sigma factor [Acetobacter garciniae]
MRGGARFYTRDPAQADDLVQETVLRALAAADTFLPGSNMRAWCFTILRNFFLEQMRKGKKERELLAQYSKDTEQSAPGSAAWEGEDVQELENLLWQLSPVLREALVLIGAQEMTYAEAAQVCGVEVGTMKARVSRARSMLRTIMEHRAQDPAPSDRRS